MYLSVSVLLLSVVGVLGKELVKDYPRLPTMWNAETIEPGAPSGGKGVESYNFVSTPSYDNPSGLWSNYTDCQRLIYVPNNYDERRYLLGCDGLNCCWEEQEGNHVEFQIPNVHYTNPNKKVDVYWRSANVTNYGEIVEADEWSWSWTVKEKLSQEWRAYTLACDDCVNKIELIQWQSRVMGGEWFAVEFKGYRGIDRDSDEGESFKEKFVVPEICKKNNLLECPSGLHEKYFGSNLLSGGRQSECNVAKYLRNAGFPSSTIGTMVCISKYESSWNCDATNKNVDGSTDYGLFEINSYYWCSGDPTSKYNECGASCSSLMDCQKNTNCAYRVYKEQGYNGWYGYKNHKNECDNYEAPVCEEILEEYEPVSSVDLSMYSGRWYQVYKDVFDMTFQGEGRCAVADYTIIGDKVGVLNSQINKDGKVGQISGFAFYEKNNSGGELSVTLDGVPRTTPYWIIELGPIVNNKYDYSIVSDNNRISLFVLTRDVDRFNEKYDKEVKNRLSELGFTNEINKPKVMSQEDCDYNLYNYSVKKSEEKCCESCEEGTYKYYSIPSKTDCGESCISDKDYNEVHLFEWGLKKAETDTPCKEHGYTNYVKTEMHSALIVSVHVDFYEPEKRVELKGQDCGVCGKAYQTCCIGFGAQGYPCDCHLQEGGSGKAGENCGDCGTGYAGCCIGYAADGYPCECDVE
jgi:lipocalin